MCVCPFRQNSPFQKHFFPQECGAAEALIEVEIVTEDTHVNEDIVWLSLIKMFPHGCRIHRLIQKCNR